MTIIPFSNKVYGSSSEESLPVSPERKWGYRGPNHVRILLLDGKEAALLTSNTEFGWDLPLFKYKSGIEEGIRSKAVCRDFMNWFGHDIQFVYVVELLGSFPYYNGDLENDEAGRLADLKLVVLEPFHRGILESCALPDGAVWKDAAFVSDLLKRLHPEDERLKPIQTALKCIEPASTLLASIPEPRLRLGWCQKAREYLESLVGEHGAQLQPHIIQEQASFTSTIIKAETAEARYFLKAPSRGSSEILVTETVSSQISGYSLDVLGVSRELECFVTKEVIIGKINQAGALRALGHIHIQAIPLVEQLKSAGCVVRDLEGIRTQLKLWAEGYHTERAPPIALRIAQSACYLMYLCRRIGEIGIPLTLVHGDFAPSNVAHDPEDPDKVLLFDWEFACISHPFLDFWNYRRNAHLYELSDDEITTYVELWKDYGDVSTLKEALKMGTIVGQVLRIWALWDRSSMCEHQERSALREWMIREADDLDCSLSSVIAADEGYPGSPEARLESTMFIVRW